MNQPDRCQSCKQVFTPQDDIVICPHCGAPYHRACYQKEGQCVYHDKHTQGFEYTPPQAAAPNGPPSPPPGGQTAGGPAAAWQAPPPAGGAGFAQKTAGGGTVCPNCRTINEQSHIFCESCGYPLHNPQGAPSGNWQQGAGGWQPPPPPPGGMPPPFMAGGFAPPVYDMQGEFDGIPKNEWASFIGPSVQDYFLRMGQQDRRKSKFSFTLSAFFFSHLYFAYRKMWGWALVAVALQLVLSAPSYLAIFSDAGISLLPGLTAGNLTLMQDISLYLQIVRNLAFGVFSLYLYRKSAVKKIQALRSSGLAGLDYQTALTKKGGVSVLGVVAVLAFFFLVVTLLVMYGGEPFMTYMMGEGSPFNFFGDLFQGLA